MPDTDSKPAIAKVSQFWLDQFGRAPLYVLLMFALWQIHTENKATQAHLVKVLESTIAANTSAMDAIRLELQIHRATKRP